MNASRSGTIRRAVVAALVVAAFGWGAQLVDAHSGLKESSPRAGERVTTPVNVVRLTFNETVSAPRLVVRDSQQRRVVGTTTGKGARVEFRPRTPLPNGTVSVTWQVRSRDGHTVSGKFAFVVATSRTGKSTP